jgi:multidrug transporter EmrE-like cation transporter
MVYQIYMNISIFFSSSFVLIWYPLYLEPWAILSATLWVTASILSIFAVNHIGMSIAAGIWCGTSMITSFLWGVIVFEKEHPVKSLPLSILALGVLILGTSLISIANRPYLAKLLSILKPCKKCKQKDEDAQDEKKEPLLQDYDSLADTINDYDILTQEAQEKSHKPWFGVVCAVLTGYENRLPFLALFNFILCTNQMQSCSKSRIPNGSMMAPMNWARPEVRGLPFAAPFGIGILTITPVFALVYFAFIKRGLPRMSDFKVSWWRGMLSGIGWNIGNVARYVNKKQKNMIQSEFMMFLTMNYVFLHVIKP